MTSPSVAPPVLVEACVTAVDEAVAAVHAGAHRLELCRDLKVGGLTPPRDVLHAVLAGVDVPVFAMARPRGGDFVLRAKEVEETVEEIHELADAGAHGIVVGALMGSGAVDAEALRRFVDAAGPLPVTFHRAFDQAPEPLEALETVAEAGAARVLTSGSAPTALQGSAVLAALVERSAGRVHILAGGGVRGDHVRRLVSETGVREVHARASGIPGVVAALRG